MLPENLASHLDEFQSALLAWFRGARRSFPWREGHGPYGVLIAEKLLQHTAAREGVVRAFTELIEDYPNPLALATANPADVERIVRPLGLPRRARELQAIARALVADHGSEVPRDLRKLKELPGVGEYSSQAVLSFAFGEDAAVVDTNVARFLFRVCGLEGVPPSNPSRSRKLAAMAQALLPAGRSRDFNHAIIDLCALICRPVDPRCPGCPVRDFCNLAMTANGDGLAP